ncbi:unnamed protein product [Cuscuta europaea]|uniref:BZIP domain-containing protein n=1 Tax=Cuscuta europaea TaxID=41803 RepID=A0A9P0Z943_CUSEU|nr:unnamed protein product [Cuscuta europaea]
MGSNMNFRNFGNEQPGSFGLVRQSSIYSLTFDEFQSTMASGGMGKDFGSMNMDELLKNIWSAEENQTIVGSGSGGGTLQNGAPFGHLQRQGSLTLPRTISQKTVDEVWKDILKDYSSVPKDGNVVVAGGCSSMPNRQQTLGEMTLEEFLSRAGVVREDTQMTGQPHMNNSINNNNGVFSESMSQAVNSTGLEFAFQPAGQNGGLMSSRILENNSEIGIQSANLLLHMNGGANNRNPLQHNREIGIHSGNMVLSMNGGGASRPSQPLPPPQKLEEQHEQQQKVKQKLPLFPKQPPFGYGGPMTIPPNGQLHGSNGLRGDQVMGVPDNVVSAINGNLIQGLGVGGRGGTTVATGSPAASSDGLTRSNGDMSSVSPVPYTLNGSLRGRKNSALEKVVERRQRRMIKNRESAARSRARKQAYTTDLEQEVAKLKEENKQLRKKQAEMLEMQKAQGFEMSKLQGGAKRRCLRRTQTGPW